MSAFFLINYKEMQSMFEAISGHAVADGVPINASKNKAMSSHNPVERRQAILLGGEPLEEVDSIRNVIEC